MGCDIHSVGQVRINGVFKTVRQDIAGDPRNYDMFAVLADVRNGYGLAGVPTGQPYVPISNPRGIPTDFEYDQESQEHPIPTGTSSGNDYPWVDDPQKRAKLIENSLSNTKVWMGDHSHSWLTLAEIKDYAKDHERTKRNKVGVITEDHYRRVKCLGITPEEWSGDVYGRNIVKLDAREYDRLAALGELPQGKEIYVRYTWQLSALSSTGIDSIIEELSNLAKEYGVSDEDTRMVFGFDS